MSSSSTMTRHASRGGKTGHVPRDHYQEVTDPGLWRFCGVSGCIGHKFSEALL